MNDVMLRLAALTSQRALLMGLGATAFYFFFIFNDGSTVKANLARLETTLAQEKLKEKDSDVALKEIDNIQASIVALSDQFKLVSTQLPTDLQMSEIIRTVDKISEATGLVISDKEPLSTVRQDVLEILPLKINARGGFNEVTMFLYYLSTIERIVRVKSFSITAPQDNRTKDVKLRFSAELMSYRFLPPTAEVKK